MQMNKLFALIALVLVFNTAHAADGPKASKSNPSVYLETVANGLIDIVKTKKAELAKDENLAKKLVRENLLPAIDTVGFAKRTIGKTAWSKATKAQQTKFIDLFIELVIGNYAKGLSMYDGQIFKFSDAKLSKSGNSAKVRSSMEQKGSTPIIIDYLLSKKSGDWKIINLTIEGVSMIKSYKSQFTPRLKALGFEQFLVELETKKI